MHKNLRAQVKQKTGENRKGFTQAIRRDKPGASIGHKTKSLYSRPVYRDFRKGYPGLFLDLIFKRQQERELQGHVFEIIKASGRPSMACGHIGMQQQHVFICFHIP